QQRRLWRPQRNEGSCYRFLSVLKLSGGIDVAALKATLTEVVSRHEILRTTFRPIPGLKDAAQVVSQASEFSLDEMVLEGASREEVDAAAEAVFCRELAGDFDLENGPALRAVLAAMPGGEYLLFLGAPALCADAETEKYLAREIFETYRLLIAGSELSV